jgi:hypothetical protein
MARKAALAACCLMLVAVGVPGFAEDAKQPPDSALKTVQALEARLATAFVKKDLAFLDSVIAADAIHVGSDGVRIDKNRYLGMLAKGRTYSAYVNKDMVTRVYGDAAIVNGPEQVTGVFDGWKGSVDFVTTRVWAYRDGKWRIVLWQATGSKPAPTQTNHPMQKWFHER